MEVCGGSGESRQLEGDVQTYSLLCTCDLFKACLGKCSLKTSTVVFHLFPLFFLISFVGRSLYLALFLWSLTPCPLFSLWCFSIALSVCLSVSVFSLSSCLSLVSHSVFSLSLSLSFYLALIPSVCLSLFQSQFSLSRQRTL